MLMKVAKLTNLCAIYCVAVPQFTCVNSPVVGEHVGCFQVWVFILVILINSAANACVHVFLDVHRQTFLRV